MKLCEILTKPYAKYQYIFNIVSVYRISQGDKKLKLFLQFKSAMDVRGRVFNLIVQKDERSTSSAIPGGSARLTMRRSAVGSAVLISVLGTVRRTTIRRSGANVTMK